MNLAPNTRRPSLGLVHMALACWLATHAGCRKAAPDEHVRSPSNQGTAAVGGGSTSGSGAGSGTGGGAGDTGGSKHDAEVVMRNDAGEIIVSDAAAELDSATDASLPPPPPFTKSALLQAFADCATEQYADFQARAESLVAATNALAADPTSTNLDAARDEWLDAMQSWQRAELFRFGPAASSAGAGGQDLRDQIYIFPLANPCKVDQQIVDKTYQGAAFSSSLGSARGLSALEYLLFYTGASNACLPSISINKNGTWAALGSTELTQRRADYAAAAAADVRARAVALVQAWASTHGNFEHAFTHPGGGSPYLDELDALNAVSDALFYVEEEVKDYKLGWPLGLVPDCINAPGTCPTAVESRYARVSTDHLRQNLIAARKLFEGCGDHYYGLGFDDWLVDIGEDELAERMRGALVNAQNAVDALSPALEQAIFESPPSQVSAVHAAVKAFTDPLKTELVTVLNIDLPATAQGDND